MREGTMAARLLQLLVVMLVFVALYGCAQEAAKDRQPMKRVKEPTAAQIAPNVPEESDDRVQRAKKAGVVVRAGNSAVVARAGEAVVRVGGFKTAKREGVDASAPSGGVTLNIEGSPGTKFSGTCIIGGKEEKKVNGRVPKRFIYELDGQRLECAVRKQSSNSGEMKVEFSAGGHTNSVQFCFGRSSEFHFASERLAEQLDLWERFSLGGHPTNVTSRFSPWGLWR